MDSKTPVQEIKDDDLLSLSSSQVACELEGEVIILNLPDGQYYGLNEVGARIWALLQEPQTLNQLRDVLLDEFDIEPELCSMELKGIVRELADSGLVNVKQGTHVT